MILGAHILITEGLPKAPEKGRGLGCDAIQLFTKNNNQWRSKPLAEKDAVTFKEGIQANNIRSAFAHTSYLINLGTPNPELYQKSLDAIQDEVARATMLGLDFVVLHPGAHTGSGEPTALKQIAKSIQKVIQATRKSTVKILFENTAGQGTCVGYSFEHLAELLDRVGNPSRTGICFDTCHAFAADYALETEKGCQAMWKSFDKIVGLKAIHAFHLNDSKREKGARVDRHEHIGKGHIGLPFFKCLMNDKRFAKIPMVLETPKDNEQKEDLMNLKTLRSLITTN